MSAPGLDPLGPCRYCGDAVFGNLAEPGPPAHPCCAIHSAEGTQGSPALPASPPSSRPALVSEPAGDAPGETLDWAAAACGHLAR